MRRSRGLDSTLARRWYRGRRRHRHGHVPVASSSTPRCARGYRRQRRACRSSVRRSKRVRPRRRRARRRCERDRRPATRAKCRCCPSRMASGRPPRYELGFDGLQTGLVDFSVNSPTYNALIRQALEGLTVSARATCALPSTRPARRRRATSSPSPVPANQNVAELSVVSSSNVTVAVGPRTQVRVRKSRKRSPGRRGAERLRRGAERFDLHAALAEGTRYRPPDRDRRPATTVEAASIRRAAIGADVTVTGASGEFAITFGGDLSGIDVAREIDLTAAAGDATLDVVQRGETRTETTTESLPAVDETSVSASSPRHRATRSRWKWAARPTRPPRSPSARPVSR